MHVTSAQGGQKRALYHLELELWMALNLGPLQEQQVLLTSEPSLQPSQCVFDYMLF